MQIPPSVPQTVDLLLEARWLIPIEPEGLVLERQAIAVDAGRILDVLPQQDAALRYRAKQSIRLDAHVVLPGFVNLHCHAAMSLLRGFADDLPLDQWLAQRIWPAERRHLSPAFVYDGSLLGACEMLRGGITTCNDMYFYPEAAAQAFSRAGMRARIGLAVVDFATPYATDAEDYLSKGLAARDAWRDTPRIDFALAPHAPYSVSDRSFERIALLADQLDLGIHMHVHETQREIEESLQRYGKRPLQRIAELGLLSSNLLAVHATQLTADEIVSLAQHGCAVAHCPTSNMKLASGIAPVGALLERNVSVGLGSDGAASNNRLDLLQELRQAALLAKLASAQPLSLKAHQSLRMATLNGAKALGLDRQIGSIAAGKLADLCAIRLDEWILQPCFDPASHIVYAAGREHVSHVWVEGKMLVEAGQLRDIDMLTLLDSVKLWQNRLSS